MDNSALRKLADSVRSAPDPVRKGREVLLDEYRRIGGVHETSVALSAGFELIRSIVAQAAYEALGPGTGWLRAVELEAEMDDASKACGEHLRNGLANIFMRAYPEESNSPALGFRRALELEAISPYRFLGSTRMHVPGLGYAVSVRKRYAENQDSYRICSFGRRKAFVFGDGCGSARFASLASHLAVREALWKSANGIGRAGVCDISETVAAMLNDEKVRALGGNGLNTGISTLLVGLTENGRSKVFKVGDSIPFMVWNDGDADMLEELAVDRVMRSVIGTAGTLVESSVEEYERESGRMVLTSDGITNYLDDCPKEIARWTTLSDDPVIISERLMRSVLRNQMAYNHSDDATIIVEDSVR